MVQAVDGSHPVYVPGQTLRKLQRGWPVPQHLVTVVLVQDLPQSMFQLTVHHESCLFSIFRVTLNALWSV